MKRQNCLSNHSEAKTREGTLSEVSATEFVY